MVVSCSAGQRDGADVAAGGKSCRVIVARVVEQSHARFAEQSRLSPPTEISRLVLPS